MAGTCVLGEGEAPVEMEQERSLGRLKKRNSALLWKVGGTCRMAAPWEAPTPLGTGEDSVAITTWCGPHWARCRAGRGIGRDPTALVRAALRAEKGAGRILP